MQVVLVMGLPASGKSSHTQRYVDRGHVHLSRDASGGGVDALLPAVQAALAEGRSVVLDNLFLTAASRAPFVRAAARAGVPVQLDWLQTSFEDAQLNALHRMWDRYGRVFLTEAEIRAHPDASSDPNIFPIVAMYAHRKRLQGERKRGRPPGKPSLEEGFDKIEKIKFVRTPRSGSRRALILDYDGTLRRDAKELGALTHYPTTPAQVQVLPNRTQTLQRYVDDGYLLLGISTQSGIGKGVLTQPDAEACFDETHRQLGHTIDVRYCPHHSFPVSCYCRNPQAGLGVQLIRSFDLDPAACLYVGDLTSDRTFAARCGFAFEHADDFFAI